MSFQQGKVLIKKANFDKQAAINLTDYLPVQSNSVNPINLKQSIKLIENDSIIISNNTRPYYQKDQQTLMFCDLTLNRILKYSTSTGNIVKIINPPFEFKHYFAKNIPDITNPQNIINASNMNDSVAKVIGNIWQRLDSLKNELVDYQDFFINGTDTIAIALLWGTYYNLHRTNKWFVTQSDHWFKYSNGKFELVGNENLLMSLSPIHLIECKPFSQNELLCRYIILGKEDTLNARYKKSDYEFIKLNTKDWTMTKFFKYKSFNPDYEGDDDYIPNIIKYATNGYSEFVAFDYLTKQTKVFHNDSMIAEIPTNEILKKYRKNDKDLIILNDLFLTKDKVALAFSKKENESATIIILLIYDKTGRLISEGTYNNNDRLMDLYCLDLDDNGLVLLDKWRYKRWSIDFFSMK
ncbi:MAG: hypothetical protein ABFD00_02995 [Chloroherpetonaceae bacterium]|nr:hypothetical protein [bacterium]